MEGNFKLRSQSLYILQFKDFPLYIYCAIPHQKFIQGSYMFLVQLFKMTKNTRNGTEQGWHDWKKNDPDEGPRSRTRNLNEIFKK